jgi:hypothetical protein
LQQHANTIMDHDILHAHFPTVRPEDVTAA